jgi:hypothetical protein
MGYLRVVQIPALPSQMGGFDGGEGDGDGTKWVGK